MSTLIRHMHLATMAGEGYGEIANAALLIKAGRIAWLGPEADLPVGHGATEIVDGRGGWLTPGLIDCHTHLVFGGNRAQEWEMRLNGASYEDIARMGGGIRSTVQATRESSEDELYASARMRLNRLIADGVTTVEIKSGYGLDLDNERKMLQVASRLGAEQAISVRKTFLAAHALPPEFDRSADDYIDACIEWMGILHAEGLIDAVDAFCETIGFSSAQTERLFNAAKVLGLPVKLHAEQLSDQGGAGLVARFGGLSADHIEWLNHTDIAAMKAAGTIAVLLPAAFYCLRETRVPPIQALRDAGVPMAVSTDCNPGTAPAVSMLLALNMACTLFRLTPQEALRGVTCNAAAALGIADSMGTLEIGKRADLALWQINRPAELCYWLGATPLLRRWVNGMSVETSGENHASGT